MTLLYSINTLHRFPIMISVTLIILTRCSSGCHTARGSGRTQWAPNLRQMVEIDSNEIQTLATTLTSSSYQYHAKNSHKAYDVHLWSIFLQPGDLEP